mgnify:CR=1 FL=1
MKKALVCGAGGFIGGHMVKRLKDEGYWVRGMDVKNHQYGLDCADEFILGDLTDPKIADLVITEDLDEIYQLAADMGGAGYIFTGENDAAIMHNSAICNLNALEAACRKKVSKIFYSSSACIYPEYNQLDPENPNCKEDSAYPAAPDSEYGWEKLFSERLYVSYAKNFGIKVRIARFHNVFGPLGAWNDGPVNIGSDEMISINNLAKMIISISGKNISIKNIVGPLGVRGRNSDNRLIEEKLNWRPSKPLVEGIRLTYDWIAKEVMDSRTQENLVSNYEFE